MVDRRVGRRVRVRSLLARRQHGLIISEPLSQNARATRPDRRGGPVCYVAGRLSLSLIIRKSAVGAAVELSKTSAHLEAHYLQRRNWHLFGAFALPESEPTCWK